MKTSKTSIAAKSTATVASKFDAAARLVGKFLRYGRRSRRVVKFRKATHYRRVRYPWEKSEKEIFWDRKEGHRNKGNKELATKLNELRVKFPERHKPSTVGPGYPGFALIYANAPLARGEKVRAVLKRKPNGKPLIYEPLRTDIPHPVPDNVFHEFCHRIGIEKYKIEDLPKAPEAIKTLDLKPCDLHWEDIRIERNVIVRELKHLPLSTPVELHHLKVLDKSIRNVSRSCYFASRLTLQKSEDVLHILVWLMNRRNIPVAFHIKVLQAISLLCCLAPVFKLELVLCGGVRVLYRAIQIGLVICPLQACWACYALAMSAIGCPEAIAALQSFPDFDETIGELTFSLYWYYWPANFANILQGIVCGPGGVANSDELFSFL